MKKTIAVLITCHNRREKTLKCLQSLFQCILPENFILSVFLVDDGSSDGTGDAVKREFPTINVINGNGNLYWNKGMRLAWKVAVEHADFDFYLWLNDDTIIDDNALINLLECNAEIIKKDNKPAIVTGACRESYDLQIFSYGGKTDKGPVFPNGRLQACQYINGNLVLIPKEIYHLLGYLSPDYTHFYGDYDYGLTAIRMGINCYTTKSFIAYCSPNEGVPDWCNPQIPLIKRLKLFHSPKGINIREYNTFRKKFWNWKWIMYAIKAYFRVLTPRLYKLISIK